VMDTNFWGVVNGTMAFLPHLIASGDGHLVNISSLFGLIPIPTQSAYVASKFAVRGFTESLRIEMLAAKMPVRVTCVHPGGVNTAIARSGTRNAGSVREGDSGPVGRKFLRMPLRKPPPSSCAPRPEAVHACSLGGMPGLPTSWARSPGQVGRVWPHSASLACLGPDRRLPRQASTKPRRRPRQDQIPSQSPRTTGMRSPGRVSHTEPRAAQLWSVAEA
jgi:hypothetical protein